MCPTKSVTGHSEGSSMVINNKCVQALCGCFQRRLHDILHLSSGAQIWTVGGHMTENRVYMESVERQKGYLFSYFK